jgi:hypothetical protein
VTVFDPDMIAAVRGETHRRAGLLLTDREAAEALSAALRGSTYPAGPDPAREAATGVLRAWAAAHPTPGARPSG